MQQQVFYIHNLLTNILGKENQTRRKSEAQLMALKKESPTKCGLYMIKIMQESQDQSVRLLTAVLLRRFVSVVLDQDNSIWKFLSQNDRNIFKQQCLLSLQNEKTKIVRIRICDLVAELGGSISQTDDKHWEELLLQISAYLQSESQNDLEIAFRICQTYITYAFDQFKEHFKILSTVIEKSITSENYNLAQAAVDCFASVCALVEEEDLKNFGNLLVPLLQLPVRAINSGDQEAGRLILITLTDIVQTEPKFFRPKLDLVSQMSHLIIKADLCDPDIKTLPVQFMINFVEKSTKFVKKQQKFLESLFEIILKLMVESDQEPTNQWMNPPEGYSMKQAEEADEMIKNGRNWVDNLISSLGTEITLPMISQIVDHALLNTEQQSWQWKAAALMVVSQVGQYIDYEKESVEKMKHIVPVIVNNLQHKHPKVRYAAAHAIGQISDDMRPQFQENFHELVMPAMYQLLNDSISRIVAHAAGCIANVIQGMEKQTVEPYMEQFLKKLMELLESPQTCSLIKEGAAACITSVIQAAQDKFAPFFQNLMNILLVGIKNMNSKSLITLRGHCIECVSMLVRSVGKQASMPFIQQIVDIFSAIVDSKQSMDDGDITRSFIFSAWGRISRILQQDLCPYMNRILPGLIQMAQQKIMVISIQGNEIDLNTGQQKSGQTKDQENKKGGGSSQISAALKEMTEYNKSTKQKVKQNKVKFSLSTAISEEKSIAIQMISNFIEHMDSQTLIQYIQKFSELAIVLTNENLSSEVRQIASNTLVTLITQLKKTKLQEVQGNTNSLTECASVYIKTLWGALRTQSDNQTIITQLYAIKSIIEEVGQFLEVDEINQMGEKLMLLIKQSDQRTDDNERLKKTDEVEQSDIDLLQQDNENQQDVQISIAQIFGTLFKTHKEKCSALISALSERVIPNWISDDNTNKQDSQNKKKLAVYILDDIIEYLGPKLMGEEFYNNCVQLFIKYSTHGNHQLRQAAVYGVGISAISGTVPQQNLNLFSSFAENSFKTLINTLKQFPKPKGKKGKNKILTQWGHARDNSIAALGKILKHYVSSSLGGDAAQMWLAAWAPCLPLEFDSGEGVPQHQYLMELIGKDQESMITSIGGLQQCLKLFGKILFTRFINKETYQAIQMLLFSWGQNASIQEKVKKIVKAEDFKVRWVNRIERCLKNQPYKQWSEGIDGEKMEEQD